MFKHILNKENVEADLDTALRQSFDAALTDLQKKREKMTKNEQR